MPELPEVEIVCRGLEPALVGSRFVRVEQRRPDLRFPLPEKFAERLEGRQVLSLARRAKYILVQIEGGEVLVMHLGMSGRVLVVGPAPLGHNTGQSRSTRGETLGDYVYGTGHLPQHDHVVFHMSQGSVVTYNDPRRFGFMLLIGAQDIDHHPLFRKLGVEPLGADLSACGLALSARGRKADLKAFLMDQRNIAGLGNIYVCEALFRAGLSPLRKASCLSLKDGLPADRTHRVVAAVRSVLADAVEAGGSTLRDYRHADGTAGKFQSSHAVYDREGDACIRAGCRGVIRRRVQSARSTFYCPVCQR
jgi:formamidopyrimidine-DNA glycosylase